MWERKKLVIDDIFTYAIAIEISKGNDENDYTKSRSIMNVDKEIIGQNGKKQFKHN